MSDENRQVRLKQRPVGRVDDSTWEITSEPVPEPGDGQVGVEVTHVSLDPAMRGWLNDARSYIRPVAVGDVMRAHVAGRVTASNSDAFSEGDLVTGVLGVQEHAVADPGELVRVDTSIAPPPTWLGALGMTGFTAYFGLLEVGRAKEGDVVVVSGAAGAVGSVTGQIAKARGCTVVGIAGGEEKCAWLTDELGFDAAVDYKAGGLTKAIRQAAPEGIDVFFDNVGGETLDAGLAGLKRGARVVICGAISTYNATELPPGPVRYMSLLVNRASMTGFVVFDYADRYAEAAQELGKMVADGSLVAREQVIDGGVERFSEALNMLFDGANTGKLVLATGA